MFLSDERLCRFHAARTAAQSSGAVVPLPVTALGLNWCFLIFAASSRPRIVTAAVSGALEPEHRPYPLFYPAVVLLNHITPILRMVELLVRSRNGGTSPGRLGR